MSPTPLENAAFRVTFTETNLRYLLGADPIDEAAVARCRAQLTESKEKLDAIERSPRTSGSKPPPHHL